MDLRNLMLSLGFEEIKGSHHIFRRTGIVEPVNLQRDGSKAKPCQVRQARRVIVKYKMAGDANG